MEPRRFAPAPATTRSRPVSASWLGTDPQPNPADGIFWWRGLVAAADGAFALARDGRIMLWNLAAARITGYEADDVLRRRCCDVFVGRDVKGDRSCSASCRLLGQIRNDESVETFDLRTTSKAGRLLWLNMSTVVLPVTDAAVPRVIRLFRDVTAVKDVLALVRHRLAGTPPKDDSIGRLTRREVEVLRLMASGLTNRALAQRLHVSPATIRNHTHNIFEKLGVPNRLIAVTYAISQFLV
jgi:PAS domain S-box-containing protein